MLLRSGNIYMSDFPYYLKQFCNFNNPYFCSIWDSARDIYNHHIGSDVFNFIKHREASTLFQAYIYNEVKKIYLEKERMIV